MSEVVLVPQPYGRATQRFIDALSSHGAAVVLLAPVVQRDSFEPHGTAGLAFADYTDPEAWLKIAVDIALEQDVSHVGTTWEFSVGLAAMLRERLGLPGIGTSKAERFRNKDLMSGFLGEVVHVPRSIVVNGCELPERSVEYGTGLFPAVLKPLNGAANLGVKYVATADRLSEALCQARIEAKNSPFGQKGFLFDDRWLLTRYIPGREFEADVYVVDGKVRFVAIQEKSLVEVSERDVVEVRTVIPPRKMAAAVRDQIQKFIETLALHVHEFTGERQFLMYPEFRISSEDAHCYCLELAFRLGGTWDAVSRAYHVDLFDLAARATLGREPVVDLPQKPLRAVSCQALYSDHPGLFIAIHGLNHQDGTTLEQLVPAYHVVTSPRSEYLAFAFAAAEDPETAEQRMNDLLRNATVATIVATSQRTTEQ